MEPVSVPVVAVGAAGLEVAVGTRGSGVKAAGTAVAVGKSSVAVGEGTKSPVNPAVGGLKDPGGGFARWTGATFVDPGLGGANPSRDCRSDEAALRTGESGGAGSLASWCFALRRDGDGIAGGPACVSIDDRAADRPGCSIIALDRNVALFASFIG